ERAGLGGLQRRSGQAANTVVSGRLKDQLEVPGQHREKIVKVMRESGSQATYGLGTTGPRELLLDALAPADIAQCAGEEPPPGVVAPLADRQLHVDHAAVFSTGGDLAANSYDLADASL